MLKRIVRRRYPAGAAAQERALKSSDGRYDYRSPEGRRVVTANRAHLALHPEWRV
jgi:hypothetical protein